MKTRNKIIIFVLAVLLMISSLSFLYVYETRRRQIDHLIDSLSVEEKIEQMMIVSYRYYRDESSDRNFVTEINDDIIADLKKHAFGGVILFGANCEVNEKIVAFINDLQKYASVDERPQLFIAVDQEGGSVTRIEQATMMIGNMALGAIDDIKYTEESARLIGKELKALGFNLDFAPDADINDEPNNPIIGIRSFSDDPQMVSSRIKAFRKGLNDNGVIACYKHFPGHGNTDTDSHTGLPLVDRSYEELKQNELIPFIEGINDGAEMIMTAHIQFPQIETETYVSKSTGESVYLPATLSKTILTDILRGDLGYEGVIVTDALNMDAIAKHFKMENAAKMAIEAGADMLMLPIPGNYPEEDKIVENVISYLTRCVKDGEISEERINESLKRIYKLKQKYGMLKTYEEKDIEEKVARINDFVGSRENHDIERQLAERCITLLKNDRDVLPIKAEKVLAVAPARSLARSMKYAVRLLRRELVIDYKSDVDVYYYSDIEDVNELIKDYQHLIIVSNMYDLEDIDPYSPYGEYVQFTDKLLAEAFHLDINTTLISTGLPYDTARYQRADSIITTYLGRGMSEYPEESGVNLEYGPNLVMGMYKLFSDEPYKGHLPVNVFYLNKDHRFIDRIIYERGFGLEK
jgi:beta-N-acetylhexosaminidase